MKNSFIKIKILFLFVCICSTEKIKAQIFKQTANTDVLGQNISRVDKNPSFPRYSSGGAVLDFTGDGLKDFIIPSYYSPSDNYDVQYLKLFKNMGNGTFTEVTKQYINPDVSNGLYLTGANDGRAKVFDFNKDGKMDFVFPSLWENNNYIDYDKTYGIKKLRDYFYKYNGNYIETRANGGFTFPSFFYQDSTGIKKGYNLFDKFIYAASLAVTISDINNDGYEDLLYWQTGYLTKDSTITDWINGITIWQNNAGKGFKFSQLNFLDTLNKTEFETDQEGSIGTADYNSDGYTDILVFGTKTPYIYNRFNEQIDSSAWDRNYRQYDHSKKIRETRLYLNNKGVFDQNNYVVIPNIRAKYSKAIDLNNDGKMDFIALWKNYLHEGKTYIDSITNKDGINSQFYVAINKGSNTFEDQTSKYIPNDNYRFSRMSFNDIELYDIDGDKTIDIFPISGTDDTLYNKLGNFAQDNPGSHATIYYKNFNNQFFKKQIIDSFFIKKSWSNYKELKNLDYMYMNYYLNYYKNSLPVKGEYLLDNLYYLNSFYLDDFNNDTKIDLLGFRGFENGYESFLFEKFGLNDISKISIGMSLFYQCNTTKPIFNTTKYSFCSGDSLKLSITNVNKGDTLKWYFGTKSDFTNVANKTFTDSSKVYITRTDSLGCIISSDTIQIVKYLIPSSPSLSRDTANNLVASINGITWYKDGVKITDTTQKIKPTTNGIYTATTTQNGCTSNISQGYYYITNAVANFSNGEFFKISPNPTSGELNINYKISSSRNISISVFDMNGRAVLLNKKVESGSKVNLGVISKGNYIIQVRDGSGRLISSQKFMKD